MGSLSMLLLVLVLYSASIDFERTIYEFIDPLVACFHPQRKDQQLFRCYDLIRERAATIPIGSPKLRNIDVVYVRLWYLYAKQVRLLYRKSGALFVALYLKQAASSLQQYYGGDRVPQGRLPVPIALTRSGLPRIIPSFIRKKIRMRDGIADMWVQIFLSLFSLHRIVPLAKKIELKYYASIQDPCIDYDRMRTFVNC